MEKINNSSEVENVSGGKTRMVIKRAGEKPQSFDLANQAQAKDILSEMANDEILQNGDIVVCSGVGDDNNSSLTGAWTVTSSDEKGRRYWVLNDCAARKVNITIGFSDPAVRARLNEQLRLGRQGWYFPVEHNDY